MSLSLSETFWSVDRQGRVSSGHKKGFPSELWVFHFTARTQGTWQDTSLHICQCQTQNVKHHRLIIKAAATPRCALRGSCVHEVTTKERH